MYEQTGESFREVDARSFMFEVLTTATNNNDLRGFIFVTAKENGLDVLEVGDRTYVVDWVGKISNRIEKGS
ncbi:hypothetical protein [Nocardia abscessus]|uniref:hypothetical protein n=1 Tax=Nocardia abscessus TaxID=120957 RepID=UPI00245729AF|nr:hypothetical protein [Nocardia abscessus]